MSRAVSSWVSAWVQNLVSKRRAASGLYGEIANALQLPSSGRLLEVGTGSGVQLWAIHGRQPGLELCGIDLSAAAIDVARRNLARLAVDLRAEGIEHTTFGDGWFDVVMCANSMSYWHNPVACFDEIHRILKPGGVARLFEPQKEFDIGEVERIIRANLANASPLRRAAAVAVNRWALTRGSAVGLRLYGQAELLALARQSRFAATASVERFTLQNLPIYVQIVLRKGGPGEAPFLPTLP